MGLVQIAVGKALAASAIRNGPIEDIHADGRISQEEMKAINKHAVDHLCALLQMWFDDPETFGYYTHHMLQGYAYAWDEPEHEAEIRENATKIVELLRKNAGLRELGG